MRSTWSSLTPTFSTYDRMLPYFFFQVLERQLHGSWGRSGLLEFLLRGVTPVLLLIRLTFAGPQIGGAEGVVSDDGLLRNTGESEEERRHDAGPVLAGGAVVEGHSVRLGQCAEDL